MKNKKILTRLIILIMVVAVYATFNGIYPQTGKGNWQFESITGKMITIYGKGLYEHMSADVAIQGIAQDYVTLFAGVVLLLISLVLARKNYLRGLYLLSGTLLYFFLTYLFYTAMAYFNRMFLAYVFLMGASLFAFILTLFSYRMDKLVKNLISEKIPMIAGIFLMVNALMIALLWLQIIIPPMLDGTVIPEQVEHYTTLVVQGFDLGIFLPFAFISGYLALRKNPWGYLFTTIYMIFLSLLMTALNAKIIFMALNGANVIPVVFIMPVINLSAIIFSILLLRNIKTDKIKKNA